MGLAAGKQARKLWTTGQVARLVGCNVKAVARWIDTGELKGYLLPGDPGRRVHRAELRRFLADHDYSWALEELAAEEDC